MSVDFSKLLSFEKGMQDLANELKDKVCQKVTNGLALKLVKSVKLKTPVGKYPKSSHKIGGTLRRGWKAKGFKIPNGYEATVFNDIAYAPYVEYGHRIVYRGKTVGFVEGRHMLEKSIGEIVKITDSYLKKKILETIREAMKNWKAK